MRGWHVVYSVHAHDVRETDGLHGDGTRVVDLDKRARHILDNSASECDGRDLSHQAERKNKELGILLVNGPSLTVHLVIITKTLPHDCCRVEQKKCESTETTVETRLDRYELPQDFLLALRSAAMS